MQDHISRSHRKKLDKPASLPKVHAYFYRAKVVEKLEKARARTEEEKKMVKTFIE